MGQSFVSSEVRGTFGYVDPEYRNNHHVNSSVDVYSFGIVLLQILSGQRVINMDTNEPMTISKMVRKKSLSELLSHSSICFRIRDLYFSGKFSHKGWEYN